MSYPTQEEELRAKEARAEALKQAEESNFVSTFRTIPKRNVQRLSELADNVIKNFNAVMDNARVQPYDRQEDLMAGLQKLLKEQINVIDARYTYTLKINPSTAKTRAQ
jgi:hypothetical protein